MALARHRPDPLADLQPCGGLYQGQLRERSSYGRQLARVHAPQYHETLFSHVYPGKQESASCYIPVLDALEPALGLTPSQRQRTVLRSDAGFGSDANVN